MWHDKGKRQYFLYKYWFLYNGQAIKEMQKPYSYSVSCLSEVKVQSFLDLPGKHHPNNIQKILLFPPLVFWDYLYWTEKHFKSFISICCIHVADNYSKVQIECELRYRWDIHYLPKWGIQTFAHWSTLTPFYGCQDLCLQVAASWVAQRK